MSLHKVYERSVEVPIRISRSAPEDVVVKKLERWPREAGTTVVLDESGGNFQRLIQMYAHDYGLEVGDKEWSVKTDEEGVRATLKVKLVRGDEVKGLAVMRADIPRRPHSEDESARIFTAYVTYHIEISEDVLAESTTRGMVEFTF